MKKALFAIFSFLAIHAAAVAGVDLGSATSHTPYDAYMQPVKQVLGSLDGASPDMARVEALMRQDHNFRYSFTTPYVAATPAVTSATKSGDCKAKALWLCDQLGDKNVRFVVGKAHSNSKMSHAWVLWQHEGRYWILDPTNYSRPIAADTVSNKDFIAALALHRDTARLMKNVHPSVCVPLDATRVSWFRAISMAPPGRTPESASRCAEIVVGSEYRP